MSEMNDKILKWFCAGEVGCSSIAMAASVAGVGEGAEKAHPYDPADLNRCLLLLEEVPEIRSCMEKVAAISPAWAALVARWGEVEECFLREAGLNWSVGGRAPETYRRMKSIYEAAEAAEGERFDG